MRDDTAFGFQLGAFVVIVALVIIMVFVPDTDSRNGPTSEVNPITINVDESSYNCYLKQ